MGEEPVHVSTLRERLVRALASFVNVGPGELGPLFFSSLYFFFLLLSYYVIRPVREQMGVSAGDQRTLSYLFTGTLAATLIFSPLFAALVSRYPRRVFLPAVYLFFLSNLVLFYFVISFGAGSSRFWAARAFFVWTSVFNLVTVSVFWACLADIFKSEQGKRLFGFIGAGGTLGAVAGSFVAATLAKAVGVNALLLVSAGFLSLTVFCQWRLLASVSRTPGRAAEKDIAETPPGQGAFSGISIVLRSPYLLAICGFLLIFTISSTTLYFEQARIVRMTLSGAAERTAFFARMDLYVNLLTFFLQVFVTGRLLPCIGVGPALTVLPAVTLAGFFGLALNPAPGMLVFVQVLRRATEFAVVKPAREVLFTVVSREEKYSSKAFIDTFVYRTGDLIGAWSESLIKLAGFSAMTAMGAFFPLGIAWFFIALFLGRRHGFLAVGGSRANAVSQIPV